MKLAEILQKARYNKRETLKVAADGIGIAVSHLHAMETGKKQRPKMEVLFKLSSYYGIPYDDICVSAYRIPSDVFRMVATSKELIQRIRNGEV